MFTWKKLQADRPGDDEKRTIVTLVKALAKATGRSQEELYDEAVGRAHKLAPRHSADYAEMQRIRDER